MRLRPLKQDEGVVGLNVLLSVIVMIFVIGFLVMIFAIMGGEIQEETYDSTTISFTNSTTSSVVNDTGAYPTIISADRRLNCVLTLTQALNSTTSDLIHADNYTITNCLITNATDYGYSNQVWNTTGSFTYDANSSATNAIFDTTTEIANVTDWFGIIIVITAMVVLILLTVIIITTIRGSGMTGTSSSGSYESA